jgi:[phosphatase 2A protein]-leucine-carboxy methyltransferase
MEPADRPIMATAEDAILAKQATVQTGYYDDPFLEPFAQQASNKLLGPRQQHQRRHIQPIIKRGTHARVCCMDRAISAFLKLHTITTNKKNQNSSSDTSTATCQIVVLGAGKDTSYFRYKAGTLMGMDNDEAVRVAAKNSVHWTEVDHASVIQEKASVIQSSPILSAQCQQLQPTKHGFSSGNQDYRLVQADLRENPAHLVQRLDLNSKLPTLFLLECVFMYLPNSASQALLQELSNCCVDDQNQNHPKSNSYIILYEPILQSDPFGNMMQHNLKKAGVATPDSCLLQTRTLPAQLDKLIQAGFSRAVGCDMWSAYETVMTPDQRRRANQSEFLDEMEEWVLIMRHYCFVAATTSSSSDSDDAFTSVGTNSPLGFLPGKCSQRMAQTKS